MASVGTIRIRKAEIIFRNFAGKKGVYNREGDRNFCVILEPEIAAQLKNDGWNVRTMVAREDGDEDRFYLGVTVRFDIKPPRIYQVTSRGKTLLDEELCSIVDTLEIEKADVLLNGNSYEINGKTGVKVYLNTAYIFVHENELDKEYADIPDATDYGRRPNPPDEEE